jgi:hypothetical protein
LVAVTLVSSSGASCQHLFNRHGDPLAPRAFVEPPTREEVINTVNVTSSRVHSLQTESASLSPQGAPSLRATITLERPRRFRLRGSFIGPEIDVGSNEEVFWLWAKSNPDPVIYYARHDEFEAGGSPQLMPIEPSWLIEAFGLVHLDPAGQHEGPFPLGNGQVALRSRVGDAGQFVRTLVVDDSYGWLLEQEIKDLHGQRVAFARTSNHRYYPAHGVSLPHHIEIELPPAQMSFAIDVGHYTVNQLAGDLNQLFTLPQMEGHTLFNLAESPSAPPHSPWSGAPRTGGWSGYGRESQFGYRPSIRGYSVTR